MRSSQGTRALRAEEGMSIAEVMIAALILAFSSIAVLNLIASGARTNYRAEQSQVVSDRLQQEMERIKQLTDVENYKRIALSAAPPQSTDPNDPGSRVSGLNYAVHRDGTGLQPMVFDVGGVAPVSAFTTGDVHGTIHRFVVWEPDSACELCKKRVIVSIALDPTASGGLRRYQELQAVISDPRAPERDTPIPPPPPEAKPWTFWLTDTSCNNSERQPLTGNHLTHNTRGLCSAGVKSANDCTGAGCTAGAPDLMVTHPPQNSTPEPLYNFATDVVAQSASQDQGLRTLKPGSSGCPALDQPVTSDTAAPYRFREIHKWLSPPIPSGYNVELDGNGTLSLWTRAVGNQPSAGRICVWLFQRHLNASGVLEDTPAVNVDAGSAQSFQYSANPWPKTKWGEISIPLHFNLSPLAAGTQMGLAVQVEQAGTGGGGLQFFYDEPSYESRLELHSASGLPWS